MRFDCGGSINAIVGLPEGVAEIAKAAKGEPPCSRVNLPSPWMTKRRSLGPPAAVATLSGLSCPATFSSSGGLLA